MLEIEMKFPASDFAPVEKGLEMQGAKPGKVKEEADHYFNAPDRDFARTDEALRIRSIGADNFVTYKGPKLDAETKTRQEIELPIAGGAQGAEDFARLLAALGYRSVAVVRKQRRKFSWTRDGFDLEATHDQIAGLGTFVELEIQAPESDLDRARDLIKKVARELGLEKSERRSYLELTLEKKQG